jgi:uncharacterized integral membrane protein
VEAVVQQQMTDRSTSTLHSSSVAGVPADGTSREPTPIATHPGVGSPPVPQAAPLESRGARLSRRAHRVRLYLYAFLGVAVLAYVVALAGSNTERLRVNWVFGHSSVRLLWLVMIAAVLGWLLGLALAALFRWRTRAPASPTASSARGRGRRARKRSPR